MSRAGTGVDAGAELLVEACLFGRRQEHRRERV